MKKRNYSKTIFALTLIVLFSVMPLSTSLKAIELPKEKKFVILVDQFHNQTLTVNDLMPVFQALNSTIPVEIAELNKRITFKALSGVDLLIIPPKKSGLTYILEETDAINEYLKYGGSILILGGFNDTVDLSNMDFLLRNTKINEESLRSYFTFHLEPVEEGEEIVDKGVYLYDEFSRYEDKSILSITLASQEIASKINTDAKNLIIQSVAIQVKKSGVVNITAPPTTYGKNAKGYVCCYTNDTPVVGVVKEFNQTRVALLGFGESLTNMTSPLGKPWIQLGDNLEFFKDLIYWLLKPERYKPKNLVRPTYLGWYFIVIAVILIPVSFVFRIREKKTEELRKEKEKQIKLSEVLKKAKEKSNK